MSVPFNIEELRLNIGGDPETERMLLSVFAESSAVSLQLLAERFPEAADAEYSRLWKTHMHQIKGAALNIGAQKLVELTLLAQQNFEAPSSAKRVLLDSVRAELARITDYIEELYR